MLSAMNGHLAALTGVYALIRSSPGLDGVSYVDRVIAARTSPGLSATLPDKGRDQANEAAMGAGASGSPLLAGEGLGVRSAPAMTRSSSETPSRPGLSPLLCKTASTFRCIVLRISEVA